MEGITYVLQEIFNKKVTGNLELQKQCNCRKQEYYKGANRRIMKKTKIKTMKKRIRIQIKIKKRKNNIICKNQRIRSYYKIGMKLTII
jgi:hypothetical protein